MKIMRLFENWQVTGHLLLNIFKGAGSPPNPLFRQGLNQNFVKQKTYLYKYVAVAVIVCLLAQDVSFAAQNENRATYTAQRTEQMEEPSSVRGALYDVPEKLGVIDETFQGTNGKKIIFIQDAHDSIDAQKNIARLIMHYVKQGVRTVFEEGYEGKVPSDAYFGKIRNTASKRKVTYYYLDQLKLGGAEYAHINRLSTNDRRRTTKRSKQKQNRDWDLIGADDKEAYLENVRVFADAEKEQTRIEADLALIHQELDLLAQSKFSASAKAWLKDRALYQEHKISPADYASKWLPQIHAEELPLLTLLANASRSKTENNSALKKASARELVNELEALESKLAQKLLSKSWQKEWLGFLVTIERLQKLAGLQLSAPEFSELQKTMTDFQTEKLARWIAKTKQSAVVLSKRWEASIKHAFRFYELAKKRDAAVEKALLAWASKQSPYNVQRKAYAPHPSSPRRGRGERGTTYDVRSTERNAILVFGGFHRASITQILRQHGFSYEVITPRITEVSLRHQKMYRHLMSSGSILSAEGRRGLTPMASQHAARALSLYLNGETSFADLMKEIRRFENLANAHPEWTLQTFALNASRMEKKHQQKRLKHSRFLLPVGARSEILPHPEPGSGEGKGRSLGDRAEMRVAEKIKSALDAFEADLPRMDELAAELATNVNFKTNMEGFRKLKNPVPVHEWLSSFLPREKNFIFFKRGKFSIFEKAVQKYYELASSFAVPEHAGKQHFLEKHSLTRGAVKVWVGAYYFDLLMCLHYYVEDLRRAKKLTSAEYRVVRLKLKETQVAFQTATQDRGPIYDATAYRDGRIAFDETRLIKQLRKSLKKNPQNAHRWIRPVARHVRFFRLSAVAVNGPRWKYVRYAVQSPVLEGSDDAKTNGVDYAILVLCLTALLKEYQNLPPPGSRSKADEIKRLELLESIYVGLAADPYIFFHFKELREFEQRPGRIGSGLDNIKRFSPSNLSRAEHANYKRLLKKEAGNLLRDLSEAPELDPQIFFRSYANSQHFWSLNIEQKIINLAMQNGRGYPGKRYRNFHATISTMTPTEREAHQAWLDEVENIHFSSAREEVAYKTTMSFLMRLSSRDLPEGDFYVSTKRTEMRKSAPTQDRQQASHSRSGSSGMSGLPRGDALVAPIGPWLPVTSYLPRRSESRKEAELVTEGIDEKVWRTWIGIGDSNWEINFDSDGARLIFQFDPNDRPTILEVLRVLNLEPGSVQVSIDGKRRGHIEMATISGEKVTIRTTASVLPPENTKPERKIKSKTRPANLQFFQALPDGFVNKLPPSQHQILSAWLTHPDFSDRKIAKETKRTLRVVIATLGHIRKRAKAAGYSENSSKDGNGRFIEIVQIPEWGNSHFNINLIARFLATRPPEFGKSLDGEERRVFEAIIDAERKVGPIPTHALLKNLKIGYRTIRTILQNICRQALEAGYGQNLVERPKSAEDYPGAVAVKAKPTTTGTDSATRRISKPSQRPLSLISSPTALKKEVGHKPPKPETDEPKESHEWLRKISFTEGQTVPEKNVLRWVSRAPAETVLTTAAIKAGTGMSLAGVLIALSGLRKFSPSPQASPVGRGQQTTQLATPAVSEPQATDSSSSSNDVGGAQDAAPQINSASLLIEDFPEALAKAERGIQGDGFSIERKEGKLNIAWTGATALSIDEILSALGVTRASAHVFVNYVLQKGKVSVENGKAYKIKTSRETKEGPGAAVKVSPWAATTNPSAPAASVPELKHVTITLDLPEEAAAHVRRIMDWRKTHKTNPHPEFLAKDQMQFVADIHATGKNTFEIIWDGEKAWLAQREEQAEISEFLGVWVPITKGEEVGKVVPGTEKFFCNSYAVLYQLGLEDSNSNLVPHEGNRWFDITADTTVKVTSAQGLFSYEAEDLVTKAEEALHELEELNTKLSRQDFEKIKPEDLIERSRLFLAAVEILFAVSELAAEMDENNYYEAQLKIARMHYNWIVRAHGYLKEEDRFSAESEVLETFLREHASVMQLAMEEKTGASEVLMQKVVDFEMTKYEKIIFETLSPSKPAPAESGEEVDSEGSDEEDGADSSGNRKTDAEHRQKRRRYYQALPADFIESKLSTNDRAILKTWFANPDFSNAKIAQKLQIPTDMVHLALARIKAKAMEKGYREDWVLTQGESAEIVPGISRQALVEVRTLTDARFAEVPETLRPLWQVWTHLLPQERRIVCKKYGIGEPPQISEALIKAENISRETLRNHMRAIREKLNQRQTAVSTLRELMHAPETVSDEMLLFILLMRLDPAERLVLDYQWGFSRASLDDDFKVAKHIQALYSKLGWPGAAISHMRLAWVRQTQRKISELLRRVAVEYGWAEYEILDEGRRPEKSIWTMEVLREKLEPIREHERSRRQLIDHYEKDGGPIYDAVSRYGGGNFDLGARRILGELPLHRELPQIIPHSFPLFEAPSKEHEAYWQIWAERILHSASAVESQPAPEVLTAPTSVAPGAPEVGPGSVTHVALPGASKKPDENLDGQAAFSDEQRAIAKWLGVAPEKITDDFLRTVSLPRELVVRYRFGWGRPKEKKMKGIFAALQKELGDKNHYTHAKHIAKDIFIFRQILATGKDPLDYLADFLGVKREKVQQDRFALLDPEERRMWGEFFGFERNRNTDRNQLAKSLSIEFGGESDTKRSYRVLDQIRNKLLGIAAGPAKISREEHMAFVAGLPDAFVEKELGKKGAAMVRAIRKNQNLSNQEIAEITGSTKGSVAEMLSSIRSKWNRTGEFYQPGSQPDSLLSHERETGFDKYAHLPAGIGFTLENLRHAADKRIPDESLDDLTLVLRNSWNYLRPIQRHVLSLNYGIGMDAVSSWAVLTATVGVGASVAGKIRRDALASLKKRQNGYAQLESETGIQAGETEKIFQELAEGGDLMTPEIEILRRSFGLRVLRESSDTVIAGQLDDLFGVNQRGSGIASPERKISPMRTKALGTLRQAAVTRGWTSETIFTSHQKNVPVQSHEWLRKIPLSQITSPQRRAIVAWAQAQPPGTPLTARAIAVGTQGNGIKIKASGVPTVISQLKRFAKSFSIAVDTVKHVPRKGGKENRAGEKVAAPERPAENVIVSDRKQTWAEVAAKFQVSEAQLREVFERQLTLKEKFVFERVEALEREPTTAETIIREYSDEFEVSVDEERISELYRDAVQKIQSKPPVAKAKPAALPQEKDADKKPDGQGDFSDEKKAVAEWLGLAPEKITDAFLRTVSKPRELVVRHKFGFGREKKASHQEILQALQAELGDDNPYVSDKHIAKDIYIFTPILRSGKDPLDYLADFLGVNRDEVQQDRFALLSPEERRMWGEFFGFERNRNTDRRRLAKILSQEFGGEQGGKRSYRVLDQIRVKLLDIAADPARISRKEYMAFFVGLPDAFVENELGVKGQAIVLEIKKNQSLSNQELADIVVSTKESVAAMLSSIRQKWDEAGKFYHSGARRDSPSFLAHQRETGFDKYAHLPAGIGFTLKDLRRAADEKIPNENLDDPTLALRHSWNYLSPLQRRVLSLNYGIGMPAVSSLEVLSETVRMAKSNVTRTRREALSILKELRNGYMELERQTGIPTGEAENLFKELEADDEKISFKIEILRRSFGLRALREDHDAEIAKHLNQRFGEQGWRGDRGESNRKVRNTRAWFVDQLRALAVRSGWTSETIFGVREKNMPMQSLEWLREIPLSDLKRMRYAIVAWARQQPADAAVTIDAIVQHVRVKGQKVKKGSVAAAISQLKKHAQEIGITVNSKRTLKRSNETPAQSAPGFEKGVRGTSATDALAPGLNGTSAPEDENEVRIIRNDIPAPSILMTLDSSHPDELFQKISEAYQLLKQQPVGAAIKVTSIKAIALLGEGKFKKGFPLPNGETVGEKRFSFGGGGNLADASLLLVNGHDGLLHFVIGYQAVAGASKMKSGEVGQAWVIWDGKTQRLQTMRNYLVEQLKGLDARAVRKRAFIENVRELVVSSSGALHDQFPVTTEQNYYEYRKARKGAPGYSHLSVQVMPEPASKVILEIIPLSEKETKYIFSSKSDQGNLFVRRAVRALKIDFFGGIQGYFTRLIQTSLAELEKETILVGTTVFIGDMNEAKLIHNPTGKTNPSFPVSPTELLGRAFSFIPGVELKQVYFSIQKTEKGNAMIFETVKSDDTRQFTAWRWDAASKKMEPAQAFVDWGKVQAGVAPIAEEESLEALLAKRDQPPALPEKEPEPFQREEVSQQNFSGEIQEDVFVSAQPVPVKRRRRARGIAQPRPLPIEEETPRIYLAISTVISDKEQTMVEVAAKLEVSKTQLWEAVATRMTDKEKFVFMRVAALKRKPVTIEAMIAEYNATFGLAADDERMSELYHDAVQKIQAQPPAAKVIAAEKPKLPAKEISEPKPVSSTSPEPVRATVPLIESHPTPAPKALTPFTHDAPRAPGADSGSASFGISDSLPVSAVPPVEEKITLAPAEPVAVSPPAPAVPAEKNIAEKFSDDFKTLKNVLRFDIEAIHTSENYFTVKRRIQGVEDRLRLVQRFIEENPAWNKSPYSDQIRTLESAIRSAKQELARVAKHYEVPVPVKPSFAKPTPAIPSHQPAHGHAYYQHRKPGPVNAPLRQVTWQEELTKIVLASGNKKENIVADIRSLEDAIQNFELDTSAYKPADKRLIPLAKIHLKWLQVLEAIVTPFKHEGSKPFNPRSDPLPDSRPKIRRLMHEFEDLFKADLKTTRERHRLLGTDPRYVAYQSAVSRIDNTGKTKAVETGDLDVNANVLYVLNLPDEIVAQLFGKHDPFFSGRPETRTDPGSVLDPGSKAQQPEHHSEMRAQDFFEFLDAEFEKNPEEPISLLDLGGGDGSFGIKLKKLADEHVWPVEITTLDLFQPAEPNTLKQAGVEVIHSRDVRSILGQRRLDVVAVNAMYPNEQKNLLREQVYPWLLNSKGVLIIRFLAGEQGLQMLIELTIQKLRDQGFSVFYEPDFDFVNFPAGNQHPELTRPIIARLSEPRKSEFRQPAAVPGGGVSGGARPEISPYPEPGSEEVTGSGEVTGRSLSGRAEMRAVRDELLVAQGAALEAFHQRLLNRSPRNLKEIQDFIDEIKISRNPSHKKRHYYEFAVAHLLAFQPGEIKELAKKFQLAAQLQVLINFTGADFPEGVFLAGLISDQAKARRSYGLFGADQPPAAQVSISRLSSDPEIKNKAAGLIAAQVLSGKHLLFVGSGQGFLEEAVARDFGLEVTATDSNKNLLKEAAAKGMKTKIADGNFLPFEARTFDGIVFPESLGHLNLDFALFQAKRILKPGGKVFILTDAPHTTRSKEFKQRLFPWDELSAGLLRHGFRTIEKTDIRKDYWFVSAAKKSRAEMRLTFSEKRRRAAEEKGVNQKIEAALMRLGEKWEYVALQDIAREAGVTLKILNSSSRPHELAQRVRALADFGAYIRRAVAQWKQEGKTFSSLKELGVALEGAGTTALKYLSDDARKALIVRKRAHKASLRAPKTTIDLEELLIKLEDLPEDEGAYTLGEIAQAAGLSRGQLSKLMNMNDEINLEIKARVEELTSSESAIEKALRRLESEQFFITPAMLANAAGNLSYQSFRRARNQSQLLQALFKKKLALSYQIQRTIEDLERHGDSDLSPRNVAAILKIKLEKINEKWPSEWLQLRPRGNFPVTRSTTATSKFKSKTYLRALGLKDEFLMADIQTKFKAAEKRDPFTAYKLFEKAGDESENPVTKVKFYYFAYAAALPGTLEANRLLYKIQKHYKKARRTALASNERGPPRIKKVEFASGRWGWLSYAAPRGSKKRSVTVLVSSMTETKEFPYYNTLEKKLISAGHAVLRVELPGHGEDASSESWTKLIPQTLDWIATQAGLDAENVSVFGHSMGGHVLLKALMDKAIAQRIQHAAVLNPPLDPYFNDYFENKHDSAFDFHLARVLGEAGAVPTHKNIQTLIWSKEDQTSLRRQAKKILFLYGEADPVVGKGDQQFLSEILMGSGINRGYLGGSHLLVGENKKQSEAAILAHFRARAEGQSLSHPETRAEKRRRRYSARDVRIGEYVAVFESGKAEFLSAVERFGSSGKLTDGKKLLQAHRVLVEGASEDIRFFVAKEGAFSEGLRSTDFHQNIGNRLTHDAFEVYLRTKKIPKGARCYLAQYGATNPQDWYLLHQALHDKFLFDFNSQEWLDFLNLVNSYPGFVEEHRHAREHFKNNAERIKQAIMARDKNGETADFLASDLIFLSEHFAQIAGQKLGYPDRFVEPAYVNHFADFFERTQIRFARPEMRTYFNDPNMQDYPGDILPPDSDNLFEAHVFSPAEIATWPESVRKAYHSLEKLTLPPNFKVHSVGAGKITTLGDAKRLASEGAEIPFEHLLAILGGQVLVFEPKLARGGGYGISRGKSLHFSGELAYEQAGNQWKDKTDIVVMMSVLSDNHNISFSERRAILAQALSNLKPGGYLLVGRYANHTESDGHFNEAQLRVERAGHQEIMREVSENQFRLIKQGYDAAHDWFLYQGLRAENRFEDAVLALAPPSAGSRLRNSGLEEEPRNVRRQKVDTRFAVKQKAARENFQAWFATGQGLTTGDFCILQIQKHNKLELGEIPSGGVGKRRRAFLHINQYARKNFDEGTKAYFVIAEKSHLDGAMRVNAYALIADTVNPWPSASYRFENGKATPCDLGKDNVVAFLKNKLRAGSVDQTVFSLQINRRSNALEKTSKGLYVYVAVDNKEKKKTKRSGWQLKINDAEAQAYQARSGHKLFGRQCVLVIEKDKNQGRVLNLYEQEEYLTQAHPPKLSSIKNLDGKSVQNNLAALDVASFMLPQGLKQSAPIQTGRKVRLQSIRGGAAARLSADGVFELAGKDLDFVLDRKIKPNSQVFAGLVDDKDFGVVLQITDSDGQVLAEYARLRFGGMNSRVVWRKQGKPIKLDLNALRMIAYAQGWSGVTGRKILPRRYQSQSKVLPDHFMIYAEDSKGHTRELRTEGEVPPKIKMPSLTPMRGMYPVLSPLELKGKIIIRVLHPESLEEYYWLEAHEGSWAPVFDLRANTYKALANDPQAAIAQIKASSAATGQVVLVAWLRKLVRHPELLKDKKWGWDILWPLIRQYGAEKFYRIFLIEILLLGQAEKRHEGMRDEITQKLFFQNSLKFNQLGQPTTETLEDILSTFSPSVAEMVYDDAEEVFRNTKAALSARDSAQGLIFAALSKMDAKKEGWWQREKPAELEALFLNAHDYWEKLKKLIDQFPQFFEGASEAVQKIEHSYTSFRRKFLEPFKDAEDSQLAAILSIENDLNPLEKQISHAFNFDWTIYQAAEAWLGLTPHERNLLRSALFPGRFPAQFKTLQALRQDHATVAARNKWIHLMQSYKQGKAKTPSPNLVLLPDVLGNVAEAVAANFGQRNTSRRETRARVRSEMRTGKIISAVAAAGMLGMFCAMIGSLKETSDKSAGRPRAALSNKSGSNHRTHFNNKHSARDPETDKLPQAIQNILSEIKEADLNKKNGADQLRQLNEEIMEWEMELIDYLGRHQKNSNFRLDLNLDQGGEEKLDEALYSLALYRATLGEASEENKNRLIQLAFAISDPAKIKDALTAFTEWQSEPGRSEFIDSAIRAVSALINSPQEDKFVQPASSEFLQVIGDWSAMMLILAELQPGEGNSAIDKMDEFAQGLKNRGLFEAAQEIQVGIDSFELARTELEALQVQTISFLPSSPSPEEAAPQGNLFLPFPDGAATDAVESEDLPARRNEMRGTVLIGRTELGNLPEKSYQAFCGALVLNQAKLRIIVFGEDDTSRSEKRVRELKSFRIRYLEARDEPGALQKVRPSERAVIISPDGGRTELRQGIARVAVRSAASVLALCVLWTILDIPLQQKGSYLTDPSGRFLEMAHTFLSQLVFASAA